MVLCCGVWHVVGCVVWSGVWCSVTVQLVKLASEQLVKLASEPVSAGLGPPVPPSDLISKCATAWRRRRATTAGPMS